MINHLISLIKIKLFRAKGFLGQAVLRKLWACNFLAIGLRMLISFLNDVYICTSIFKIQEQFKMYHTVFPKNP